MLKRLLAAMALLIAVTPAVAQTFRVPSVDEGRKGKWEMMLQINYLPAQDYTGVNGSELDLSSRTGWGFDIARNMSDYVALGFDFSWTRPRYTATIVTTDTDQPGGTPDATTTISHRADIITGQFYGAWNLYKGSFTPFLEAAAGWTYIDSNVIDSEVPPVCWWDPWWGWVCNSSTYNGTEFSYGGAAGLRWEPNDSLVLKLSYDITILDTDSGNKPELQGIKFEIGSRY